MFVIKLIETLIGILGKRPELLRKGLDALLDVVEDAVVKTPNTLDDKLVLPLCKLIRNAFGVED